MQNRDIRNEPNKGVKDPGKQINHLKNGLAEEVPQRQDLEEALEKALDELERLKQEYAQGKENYTLLLENTHDIIYAVTPEGILTYLSPHQSIFGYDPDELIHTNFLELVAPEQREEVIIKFTSGTAAGESFPVHFQIINKDGSRTWVETVGKTIFDETGNALQQVGVVRDISTQKDMEMQLRRSEEKHRALIEQSHDVIYAVGIEGTISYCSSQIEQYGYTPDEITNQNLFQFMLKEQREDLSLVFQNLIATGSSKPVRFQFIKKDNSLVWVEVVANNVYDEFGNPIERIGIMRNITYQKEMEDKLRQSEEKYRYLVEQITEVIYAVDLDGMMTYVSPAVHDLLGFEPSEIIGQPFGNFIISDDLSTANRRFQDFSTGLDHEATEYRLMTKSGEVRWARISSHPIKENDQVTGVQGVLIDITDQKLGERKLAESAAVAERERIARELHDSVTQTLYSAAAISEALPRIWQRDQEQVQEGLVELETLTHAALAEMRTLLLELRPDALESQDLPDLFNQLAAGLMGRSRMSIEINIDQDYNLPPGVKIAFYRITQEALNNIIKHARASHASVHLERNGELVKLMIKDDGVGFSPENVSSHHLGLDIMRERARDIGADFRIDSQSDIGTKVIVTWNVQSQQDLK